MATSTNNRPPFSHAELSRALNAIVETLPPHRRGPSIKACLAQQIVSIAKSQNVKDLTELSDRALHQIGENCVNCMGCEGVPARGNKEE